MILVINAGSSSLKYKLFDRDLHVRASGNFEELISHDEAIEKLQDMFDFSDIAVIAHRVVHGGEHFSAPVVIDEAVLQTLESLIPLAPLHNPANIAAIRAFTPLDITQVAVFDTAFHQSMPEASYRYALPNELYEKYAVRRYGFHGSSHEYVSKEAAKIVQKEPINAITLHIGNGVSLCAVKEGKSIDTTMGFTPLEGVVMGTRSGSIDPGIVFYLQKEGYSPTQIEHTLNKKSGLVALAGTNDMRAILSRSDADAKRAVAIYTHALKKALGAYLALLGKVDAIVFTGGIGERSAKIRSLACNGLEAFGIAVDPAENRANKTVFSTKESRIKLLCIPTDEERQIALHAKKIVRIAP